MNQTVIDIQGITKTYVNGKLSVPVLYGIDLQVNKEANLYLLWVLLALVNLPL